MIRLKKPAAAGGESKGEDESKAPAGRGAKIFGIGRGKRATAESKSASRTTLTPGELRIQKDLTDLDGGSVAKVSFPDKHTLTEFTVAITPDSGLWKSATYNFTFKVPRMYPHEPPKVKCETQIYHPNIDLEGNVCLNILREDWKPVLDLNAVIYGLIYLFYEPNPDDPLNHEAADVFRRNQGEFQRLVAQSLRGGAMYISGRRIAFSRLV